MCAKKIDRGDAEYEQARKVWNGLIDKRPLSIIRCTSIQDIQQGIQFAKEHELQVSVRGGGHSICGFSVCDDGLVIDLQEMNQVTINENSVTVQGGALWSHVDQLTWKCHNKAVPGGMVSHTGVGGLTLAGGIGWLSRAYGLTCDNLISATVVTADTSIVEVSENCHDDLLWALCGGGGNFGIVSSFTFQLHTISKLETAIFVYAIEQAQLVLEKYFEITRADAKEALPDNITIYLFLSNCNIIIITLYHEGSVTALSNVESLYKQYNQVLKLLLNLNPDYSSFNDFEYPELQSKFDQGNIAGKNYYWKSLFFDTPLDQSAISKLIDLVKESPDTSSIEIMHLGGAISKKDSSRTAFFQRDAFYEIHCMSVWSGSESIDKYSQWARIYYDTMNQYCCNHAGYVNTMDSSTLSDSNKRIRQAYGANYERLVQLKRKYDPTNFFKNNHNIDPHDAI